MDIKQNIVSERKKKDHFLAGNVGSATVINFLLDTSLRFVHPHRTLTKYESSRFQPQTTWERGREREKHPQRVKADTNMLVWNLYHQQRHAVCHQSSQTAGLLLGFSYLGTDQTPSPILGQIKHQGYLFSHALKQETSNMLRFRHSAKNGRWEGRQKWEVRLS